MSQSSDLLLSRIAALGLCTGAGFGLAGTVVASPTVQATLWAIDAVALICATSLLALKFFRAGVDLVAAGFLVFAIGEGVILSGTAAGLYASAPSFAGGTALWAMALIMISAPPAFAGWLRLLGAITAGLFAVTAWRIFDGQLVTPVSVPLPILGYPFLVATLLGWAWTVTRRPA